jgi:hypothetical protein
MDTPAIMLAYLGLSVVFLLTVTAVLLIDTKGKWRYSLRALLIATTVVAVVLGLLVYVFRR